VANEEDEKLPYEAIGRVTAEGVLLEHSLKFLLVAIEFTLTLANYANAASLSQLIDLCRLASNTGVLGEAQKHEVSELLNRADTLRAARNEIVHSLWLPNQDDNATSANFIPHKAARRQIGMHQLPEKSLDDMRSIAAEIFQLREDMFVATYNLLLARSGAGADPLETSDRIVNPHGRTSDGRSIAPDEVGGDDIGSADNDG
jgi:hypothetical protein